MDIITLLLTSLGLAMDAFSVAVTSGIFLKRFKAAYAFKIGFFFGVFQFLMPCAGWLLGCGFANIISRFAPWIAFVLLGFIGGKMIWEAFSPEEQEICGPLDNKLLTILAVATSIDALAVGITFAAMNFTFISGGIGYAALPNSLVIGIVAFVMSSAGVCIGHKSGDLFGNKAEIAGGLVLLGIGIKILAESFI